MKVRHGGPVSLGGFLIAGGTGLAFALLVFGLHMNPGYAGGVVVITVIASAVIFSAIIR